jgi:hypothetical protein
MSKPSHILLGPHHLIARFFVSLDTRPPAPEDQAWAESYLLDAERDLWRRQSHVDRRHTIKVARRFLAARPDATRAEMAGALLHDIGKLDCGLGTWGRVVASMVGPRTKRFRSYHDHEQIGADMLVEAGSDVATIELVAERGPVFQILHQCDRA